MYDVNLRFANKWILTFAFHVEAMSAKVDWICAFTWRCYVTPLHPVTAWIWRGSFASHCLRGVSALSAPLRSIFLIWNMPSIHYEEWSRRLDATSNQMDSVWDNCVSMANTQCSCCLLWWKGLCLVLFKSGVARGGAWYRHGYRCGWLWF